MRKLDAQEFTVSLMESTPAVYLATVDENGLPHVRALSNLRDTKQFPNLKVLFEQAGIHFVTYMTTFSTSEKARQIRHNANVALYYSRPKRFQGVMLSGILETVREGTIKAALWQDEWRVFWPNGPSDRKYRVYRFVPDEAKGWSGEETFRFKI